MCTCGEGNVGGKFRFVECHRRRQGREAGKRFGRKIMGELDGMELGSGFAILWVVEMAAWKMCVPPYKIADEEPRQKADGRHRQGP